LDFLLFGLFELLEFKHHRHRFVHRPGSSLHWCSTSTLGHFSSIYWVNPTTGSSFTHT